MAENLNALWESAKPPTRRTDDLSALWDAAKPVAIDTTGMSPARAELERIQPSVQSAPESKNDRASFADVVTGPADAALSIGKNLIGTLAGSVAGVAKSLIGGKYGTDAGVEEGAKTAESVRKSIAGEPITKTGGKILGAIGNVVDATKIAGLNPATALNELTPGAARVASKLSAMDAAADAKRAAVASLAEPAANGVKAAREVGYILTPSEMKAGLVARSVEGASGSPRLQKAVSAKNVEVTNDLIRKDIGLPADQPISFEALADVRKAAGAPYEQAKTIGGGKLAVDSQYKPNGLGPKIETVDNESRWLNPIEQRFISAPDAVESIKQLRADGNGYFQAYKMDKSPDTLKKGKAAIAEAEALEDLLDRNAQYSANPDLLSELRASRAKIAKTYLAQRALSETTGNIDAAVYAREFKNNPNLTGGSLAVARFAQQFPKLAQRADRIGNTDMSFADLGLASLKVGSLAESGLSLGMRPAARAILQTKGAQKMMMPKPDTGSSMRRSLTTLADLQGQSPVTLAEISAERRD